MISKNMFGKPSGNVLGMINAQVSVKGRDKTVLQHTFMVDGALDSAVIDLRMPTRASVEEVRALATKMLAFADAVEEEIKNPAQEPIEKAW